MREPRDFSQFNKREFVKRDKGNRFCTHYQNIGHTKKTCFKLHGYPEWFSEYKKTKEKANVAVNDLPLNLNMDSQIPEA